MTRPKNTVPVRLARHRAQSFASWLRLYVPAQKSLLGLAGNPVTDPVVVQRLEQNRLAELSTILDGRRKGRPRGSVATYHIPRDCIAIIDRSDFARQVPLGLRAVARLIVSQSRRKRGPRLTLAQKLKNIAYGTYSPETVRRYRWAERKRAEAQTAKDRRDLAADYPAEWTIPEKGTLAHSIAITVAQHQKSYFALFGSRTDRRQ